MVQLWEKVAAVPSLPAPPPLHGGFQSSAHLASCSWDLVLFLSVQTPLVSLQTRAVCLG